MPGVRVTAKFAGTGISTAGPSRVMALRRLIEATALATTVLGTGTVAARTDSGLESLSVDLSFLNTADRDRFKQMIDDLYVYPLSDTETILSFADLA